MLTKTKWSGVRLLLNRKAKDIGGRVTAIQPAILARFDGGQLLLLARLARAKRTNKGVGMSPTTDLT